MVDFLVCTGLSLIPKACHRRSHHQAFFCLAINTSAQRKYPAFLSALPKSDRFI
jgi:hypothetical protein